MGCGNGHLQEGEGEAIRTDCQARKATGHPNGLGRGISKGKDSVKDCREHGSSGNGRNDLRGQHLLSPFLLCTPCSPHNRKWNQPERSYNITLLPDILCILDNPIRFSHSSAPYLSCALPRLCSATSTRPSERSRSAATNQPGYFLATNSR